MTTFEVYQLFKRYTDEPDQSFMSDAETALFLKLGYAEFLRFIDEINPNTRLRGTQITMAGARTYNLNQNNSLQTVLGTPSVLGSNPNETTDGVNWTNLGRMTKLVSIHRWDPVGNVLIDTYQLVSSATQLGSWRQVLWQGNTLTWAVNQAATFLLLYNFEQEIGLPVAAPGPVVIGQPSQSWSTVITQATAVAIDDDLQAWHDMIALFAYAQYSIIDAADNSQLSTHLARRKQEFKDYLQTRSFGSTQYVANTNDPSDTTIYIA
jgi:hypothetical protein